MGDDVMPDQVDVPLPVVVASSLARRFGARLAVDDLSFEVRRGEVLALLGPNGAGKTTTMRMLAGLLRPDRGVIALDGVPIGDDTGPLRNRIGLLTETPGLWDRLSLADNLLVHARLRGLDPPGAAVVRALDRMGLAARAGDRAGTLSKGMRQKAALARALMHAPDILLLDEPTSGLDPEVARAVRDHILDLRAGGCAIVIASHNLDEVERLADRVLVINTRVVAAGAPGELGALVRQGVSALVTFAAPPSSVGALATAYPGAIFDAGRVALRVPLAAGHADVPSLVRDLVERGAAITSVVVEHPALEDVYLALVRDDSGDA